MKHFEIITADTVVVGSGAAGYNAAIRLKQEGVENVLLVTEGIQCGTSRNTGSDKQTYYKLGLGGETCDSVRQMAQDLFAGGSVDGDNALCEAALSARCFFNLAELGVPFPVNRYGEYVGYKTDHDPYARATSAGPLTSRFMTEALEKRAQQMGISAADGLLVVEILKKKDRVCGLICLKKESGVFLAVQCDKVILATGGPAGIYEDSVYPLGHTGSASLALNAGAAFQNLTEWQYGLASVSPRWNVSGTYMQVLPCFVSVDESGKEREFLLDYFKDPYEALSAVFLKGYQWPFDSAKVLQGSSVIDLLVYRECVLKKRRVYLDYRKNPFGIEEIEFERLLEEAFSYLDKAGACFGTPIARLQKMNQPAIDLYAQKGLDLYREPLEIALCAQHHNGGIAVDAWWQTSVPGLFAAGECAGTHGVTRPGGSALNAGQVGSLRAAQMCSAMAAETGTVAGKEDAAGTETAAEKFEILVNKRIKEHEAFARRVCGSENDAGAEDDAKSKDNVEMLIRQARRRMSDCGAAIRNCEAMEQAILAVKRELTQLDQNVHAADKSRLYLAYQLKDLLQVQRAVLAAMLDFAKQTRITRGSSLYTDEAGVLRDGLEELFRFCPENSRDSRNQVQMLRQNADGELQISWRPVREIPQAGDFFETVWRQYRENKNIY